MNLEKWIEDGSIKGTLDKFNAVFHPLKEESSPVIQEPIQNTMGINQSIPIKQKEFIKTETRETSQEDLVKLIVNLGYVGSNIKVGIKIINDSDYSISEVNIKILYSNIKLFYIKPKHEYSQLDSGISLRFPNIKSQEKYSFDIFFKPEEVGIGEIKGQFQYVNYKDFVRFIRIEKLFYDITPPSVVPKEISLDEIQAFNSRKENKKDIRSYGLPDKLSPMGAFNHLIQIIRSYNFKLVEKSEEPNNLVSWFFGQTDLDEQELEILVVGQIVNSKIEFFASSQNEQIISALLTAFSIDLKKRMINSRVAGDEDEIFDLYCKNCGGVLPYFPAVGKTVQCKYCEFDNLVR
jgi:hypothetical protein